MHGLRGHRQSVAVAGHRRDAVPGWAGTGLRDEARVDRCASRLVSGGPARRARRARDPLRASAPPGSTTPICCSLPRSACPCSRSSISPIPRPLRWARGTPAAPGSWAASSASRQIDHWPGSTTTCTRRLHVGGHAQDPDQADHDRSQPRHQRSAHPHAAGVRTHSRRSLAASAEITTRTRAQNPSTQRCAES